MKPSTRGLTPAEMEAEALLQAAGWISTETGHAATREAAEVIILLAKKIETQRMAELMRRDY